jgi:GntR family transcriptional repressor for pyruvate dehydrogenase complex
MLEHEFDRIERAPAYRLVYDAIERQILAGRLRAGDPLPAEMQLAEQFGVNRSTVREGIRLLEQSGLVERDGGKRPRISLPHYLDLASTASRALILHSVTFRELWAASMVLEPAIAEAAARCADPAMLAELSANLAEMEASVVQFEGGTEIDVIAFVRLDRIFHEILANIGGNRVLALAHEPVISLFIFDCLSAKDHAKARLWMHKHMDDFRRAYEMTSLSLDAPLDAVSLGVAPRLAARSREKIGRA